MSHFVYIRHCWVSLSVFLSSPSVFFLLNCFTVYSDVGTPLHWRIPNDKKTQHTQHQAHQHGQRIDLKKKGQIPAMDLKNHMRKLFLITSVASRFEPINTRTISQLTPDIKSRKLIGFKRETMDESLKSLNIRNNVWAV